MKGELKIDDQLVDLKRVQAPVLNLMAQHDHIAPYEATHELTSLVGSEDKEDVAAQGWPREPRRRCERDHPTLAEGERVALSEVRMKRRVTQLPSQDRALRRGRVTLRLLERADREAFLAFTRRSRTTTCCSCARTSRTRTSSIAGWTTSRPAER